jgi:hypothetical protein
LPDSTLLEVMDALADQLETVLSPQIDQLQVVGRMMLNPSPPTLDIYPSADPFQDPSGVGGSDVQVNLIIRGRVSPVDHEGAQDVLLGLMDWASATSVVKAVNANRTLGGYVQDVYCQPPSDFAAFIEPDSRGALLGCTWVAKVTV